MKPSECGFMNEISDTTSLENKRYAKCPAGKMLYGGGLDCPDTCPLVKLNSRIEIVELIKEGCLDTFIKQQKEIDTLKEKVERLEKDRHVRYAEKVMKDE